MHTDSLCVFYDWVREMSRVRKLDGCPVGGSLLLLGWKKKNTDPQSYVINMKIQWCFCIHIPIHLSVCNYETRNSSGLFGTYTSKFPRLPAPSQFLFCLMSALSFYLFVCFSFVLFFLVVLKLPCNFPLTAGHFKIIH